MEGMEPATSRIQIHSGTAIDPLDPDTGHILIEDIAHSLSQRVRYNGHAKLFYSVAEHSVHVSRACGADALWGLMHDAPEAYLGDLVTPLKKSDYGAAYREAEGVLMGAICARFGLQAEQPESVSVADKAMLARERTIVFETTSPEAEAIWDVWTEGADLSVLPEEATPQWWPWELAKGVFLARFYELGGRQ